MAVKLNVPKDDKQPQPEQTNKQEEILGSKPLEKISKEFTRLNDRVIVIPIGFPQAGKSLFLSSLMYYAKKGKDQLFTAVFKEQYPYNGGRKVIDEMIRDFDKGELYKISTTGTLDLIGVDIKPKRNGLPDLNLAFLDLAGEDIKNIKTSNNSAFTAKIDAVLQGIASDQNNSQVIFVLVTPFEPAREGSEDMEDAHKREDDLHSDFINYLKNKQKKLLEKSRICVIASQWDKNENSSEQTDIEERVKQVIQFTKEYRPAIYNWVENDPKVAWGPYSVGTFYYNQDGEPVSINALSAEYPSRFWKTLYKMVNKTDLDKKPWWKKLFGIK